MKEIKQVDTRLRYDSTPNHREIVASIVLQELHNLFKVEDEDWMKRRITKYMHQCLTNINKRIPMKLFQPCELYRHCHICDCNDYKPMYQPFPYLCLLMETEIDTNYHDAWLWDVNSPIQLENGGVGQSPS